MRIRPIPLLCTAAVLAVFTLSSISHASGLNVNVDVGIPVGAPPPPPPAYAPPPPVQVVLPATPPQFVFVPELGYYVAVGTPYDIAYIGSDYFLYSNGFWYRTSYYGGPLVRVIGRRGLPPLLVRHNLREFRRFREVEFRRYDRDRDHYRGQLHRPELRREEHREMRKDERREERRDERRDR
jgi:hypothetical protein